MTEIKIQTRDQLVELFDKAGTLSVEEFRRNITHFTEILEEHLGSYSGKELDKVNPLSHEFGDGCYIRKIFMPKGQVIVTKIHKKKHPYFIQSGKLSIVSQDGVQHITAPHNGMTEPGTQRLIYVHEDCVFITVHATQETDIKKITEEVIAKDYNDPLLLKTNIQL